MENAINTLRIQNFKSIKDATMNPRRVNLIIGQPNVGKSNILEAMSLLGGIFFDEKGEQFMLNQIRYESMRNLFFDNNWINDVDIDSNIGAAKIVNPKGYDGVYFTFINGHDVGKIGQEEIREIIQIYRDGLDSVSGEGSAEEKNFIKSYRDVLICYDYYFSSGVKSGDELSIDLGNKIVKKYIYNKNVGYDKEYKYNFLKPPLGNNMLDILQHRSLPLRREIVNIFKPYGLNFVVRVVDGIFEIQKDEEGFITTIPYSLIADTLQRIIFYLAAIESNDDSVLLFEEPEAHQFPVYTSMLGRKIVESKNNQFFIATHSPYLVTEILEQMVPYENQLSELAIFVAYYEDYQTKIKQLSDEEVKDIRGDGIDIFYNLSRFTPGSNLYA